MKASGGRIVFAGLMPHAPVLIPEVGEGREREAGQVVDAMQELSRRALAQDPDRLVIVSPHSPRRPNTFGLWSDPRIQGNLGRFRTPEVTIDLPVDAAMKQQLQPATWPIISEPLDHGASVPLYFLTRAGWDGPTTLLSLNYPGDSGLVEFAQTITKAVAGCPGRTVFIASGDMSHALKAGGPAGFHPRAKEFDSTFVDLIKSARYRDLTAIDPSLLRVAAEDVVDSTLLAAAAIEWQTAGNEFLAYQGPFGVGYSVAILYSEN